MRLALLCMGARVWCMQSRLGTKVRQDGSRSEREYKWGAYEVAVGIAERRDDTGRHFALCVDATNTFVLSVRLLYVRG